MHRIIELSIENLSIIQRQFTKKFRQFIKEKYSLYKTYQNNFDDSNYELINQFNNECLEYFRGKIPTEFYDRIDLKLYPPISNPDYEVYKNISEYVRPCNFYTFIIIHGIYIDYNTYKKNIRKITNTVDELYIDKYPFRFQKIHSNTIKLSYKAEYYNLIFNINHGVFMKVNNLVNKSIII